jgi:glyoxylase-like metal-dependent hydrolase (beta-lactamase superfamily II)
LPPATHTNCYVVGEDEALVVDPGSPFPGEMDRLRRVCWHLRGTGGNIQAVLLTHHHRDHVGGAARVALDLGVPIAAHPLTLERLSLPPRARGISLLSLVEGHCFRVDPDRHLEVHHTPGHAAGHLCLFDPRGQVLLSGDMVPGEGTTVIDPPEGDMALYLDSLARLRRLEPAIILPAHGPPLAQGAAAIRRLMLHRRWREHRVLQALSEIPQDLYQITGAVYSDVSPLRWPLASRSTLAHLIKLEHDGAAVRTADDEWRRSLPGTEHGI